ncbi:MAG: hypothetical protein LBI03_09030 [Clostridiales bacterium]|nr:hypothetical protein [Clostridiales bacterium]
MTKKQQKTIWVYEPQPHKFVSNEKDEILLKIQKIIARLPKLSQKVSRVHMRSNWVYMYELIEQEKTEGVIFTKPLIDGKYLEYPYARITIHDACGSKCTADRQRYNDQWMTIYTGTLTECLNGIENDDGWF